MYHVPSGAAGPEHLPPPQLEYQFALGIGAVPTAGDR
jgi:hypothetical protein